ncbi:hypothetical protein [Methanohalophilus profundi]|uniref:hypothetical protein n=1 Tax=Methanohalophilus profundi TaxID=2138083 RepID=UPI0013EA444A|nr:hypothetical protein [Methanohalophilus profundi]
MRYISPFIQRANTGYGESGNLPVMYSLPHTDVLATAGQDSRKLNLISGNKQPLLHKN